MTHRKKLIEVALPLEAINVASAREKSIRHGHPSTLHLWWARRPLAAARAVIFASLVDDPDDPDALPAFVEACNQLPIGANVKANGDTPRMRLFDFIERLVTWEATTDEAILNTARELILIATEGKPPPLLDPFAGGGSIPLEAQRLGLEAHASDLNPVAVMINKAQIEIPPRFANMPPINPRDSGGMFALTPKSLLPHGERGLDRQGEILEIPLELKQKMIAVARDFRKEPTPSEDTLWQALRNRQLEGRKIRRQQPIGPFILDFYCADERLAIEVDGLIHESQRAADAERQTLIEATGIHFVRVTANEVETKLDEVLAKIQAAFLPSPATGRGAGGEGEKNLWRGASGLAADVRYYGEWMRERAWERIGHLYPPHPPTPSPTGGEGGQKAETVIAWLWARTVKSPNPAIDAHVPLVRSFILSKKKGREAWARPIVEGERVRFEVTKGAPPKGEDGTMNRRGAICIISGEPMPFDYMRTEGQAGRMGVMLMAIVTEGKSGRNYYSPEGYHVEAANQAIPKWKPEEKVTIGSHEVDRLPMYGMYTWGDAFTPRQLVALTTFSDLVTEARQQAYQDALAAGLPDEDLPLRDGGHGAMAYAEAVSVYLAFAVDKGANIWSSITSWMNDRGALRETFARQAIPMVWDYAEANPFSDSGGNLSLFIDRTVDGITFLPASFDGWVIQADAAKLNIENNLIISTDPPYYDNIGYADLSDFFYVWMRRNLREVYPELFSTLLVPKEPELIASPYRHGGKEAANQHFEQGMAQTFANIRGFITPDYPLTVYYAFKQQDAETALTLNPSPTWGEGLDEDEDSPSPATGRGGQGVRASTGWETMLSSLIESGFIIKGTFPMRTESTGRSTAQGTNALASSIILVCRPRPADAPSISRRAFMDALRRELPIALQNLQSGNIAPVDLAQASIGPGMGIYSRYSAVLEADGSPMAVRAALGLINQELDVYLSEQDGDIDGDTRFAVAWFEQFCFDEGEFGLADVLARAKNTSVAGVETAGLVESGRGKVQLRSVHDLYEYNPNWDPKDDKRATIWEATHHLIARLQRHGETGAAMLITKMPADMAAEARQLAYRLYSICERKGWAEYARDYNALVVSWAGIGEEGARLRDATASGQATEQLNLFGDE